MVPDNSTTTLSTPDYRVHYNINPAIEATNKLDGNGNPTGGSVDLIAGAPDQDNQKVLSILWQDGPRGKEDGTLAAPNGAFVEDVLWAALQRLEFFQESQYRCRENAIAITKIEEALFIMKDRQLSRSYRGVEGKHEV